MGFDSRNSRTYNDPTVPELPEVETVARGLRASVVGNTIVGADVLWQRSVVPSDATSFERRVTGCAITGVGRRGKWLMVELSSGDTLLIHLRMSGRLVLESELCVDTRHLRVVLLLDDGRRLSFFDQRKFGRLWLVADTDRVLGSLGPEPLSEEFTAARFGDMLMRRRGRIKPLLMNQRFLAGLGNIYADEALWRAGIHPLRKAKTMTPAEVRSLHKGIRSVLVAAVGSGGTTLADAAYVQADGQSGEFGPRLAVYGRAGEVCPRCGTPVERIRIGQRGAHFCPHCQPLAESELKSLRD